MKTLLCLLLPLVALTVSARSGENDSALVIRDLDGFATAKYWRCEKNVKAAEDKVGINDHPALQLTFNIVHKQPDGTMRPGWPHAFIYLDSVRHNWEDFDNFEFWIHTTFNRPDETTLPFAVSVQNSKEVYSGHINLEKLEQNKWVKFSLPVAGFPAPHDVKRLGFHAPGAKYRDGDVLVVKIGNLRLTRAKSPLITTMKMLSPAIAADAATLAMELTAAGPAKELAAGIPVEITADGKSLWKGSLPAERGTKRYELDISKAELKPGNYQLVLLADSTGRKVESPFTIGDSSKGKAD